MLKILMTRITLALSFDMPEQMSEPSGDEILKETRKAKATQELVLKGFHQVFQW
jgi:hypothetical protein